LDNVIAVAAAAQGSLKLLILGLAISIPLVIFGSTLLLRLMERFPVIVTVGAALIGFVAGEMAIGDRAMDGWVHGSFASVQNNSIVAGVSLEVLCGMACATTVVAVGWWIAGRKGMKATRSQLTAEAPPAVAHSRSNADG
jgi:predicted tellurium resistance membrane protein TerC